MTVRQASARATLCRGHLVLPGWRRFPEGARMRRFGRLSLVAGALAAVAGGAMVAAPSMAAPGGGECTLHGTANFHPGPGAASAPFAYDFSGALTNCGDSTSGPAAFGKVTGTITAGQTLTINNVTYQEP